MNVQQRHSFAGYTLPLRDRNVNWGIGESPIAPALSRRENPEDEVLRRWKGEMQTRTRAIGAAEEAPLRTGGFRVPRLNGNYIFKPRGATDLPSTNPTPEAHDSDSYKEEFVVRPFLSGMIKRQLRNAC